jgi:hypothetical protein
MCPDFKPKISEEMKIRYVSNNKKAVEGENKSFDEKKC